LIFDFDLSQSVFINEIFIEILNTVLKKEKHKKCSKIRWRTQAHANKTTKRLHHKHRPTAQGYHLFRFLLVFLSSKLRSLYFLSTIHNESSQTKLYLSTSDEKIPAAFSSLTDNCKQPLLQYGHADFH